jgi:Ca2+-binding RTX toxin-like protein
VACVAALAVLAIGAQAASAVTVSVSGNTLDITGADENNDVSVHDNFNPGQVVVSDTAGMTIGAGCSAVSGDPSSANCGGPSVTAVVADLGNGNNKWTDNEVTSWDNLQQFSVTTGSGADNIQGHSFNVPYTVHSGGGDDTMSFTLNTTVNHLFGEDGDDTITGGGGNDVIDGGNGDDNLDGWSGNDTIDGGPGNDTITGDDGDDTITGGPGMDSIHGDVTCCSPGNDSINSVDGEIDSVSCGLGADSLNSDYIDVVDFSCESDNVVGGPAASGPPAGGSALAGAPAGGSNPATSNGGTGPGGSPGALCRVPKLKGKSLAAAKKALAKAICRLGKVKKKKSARKLRGHVLSQSPSSGRLLATGSKVAVVVGK